MEKIEQVENNINIKSSIYLNYGTTVMHPSHSVKNYSD